MIGIVITAGIGITAIVIQARRTYKLKKLIYGYQSTSTEYKAQNDELRAKMGNIGNQIDEFMKVDDEAREFQTSLQKELKELREQLSEPNKYNINDKNGKSADCVNEIVTDITHPSNQPA